VATFSKLKEWILDSIYGNWNIYFEESFSKIMGGEEGGGVKL